MVNVLHSEVPTDQQDIRGLFFQTLQAAGCTSQGKLEQFLPSLSVVESLRNLNSGQRKQFFAEFVAQASKREKEEKRKQKQLARESFHDVLDSWGKFGDLDPDISFRDVALRCSHMDFWHVLDVEELDEIFQEYMSTYDTIHRNEIREKRFELKRQLFRVFADRWESSAVLPSWSAAWDMVRTVPEFARLDDLDKFEVFEDFVKDTLAETKERKRKAERREGRHKRDAFYRVLENHKAEILEGFELNAPLEWDKFQPVIKNFPEYISLIGTPDSSQPYDLFTEFRAQCKKDVLGSPDESSDRKRSRTDSET